MSAQPGLPRGPRSALYQTLRAFRDPYGVIMGYLRTYGDPMTVPFIGIDRLVVTGDPEAIRAIFTAPAEQFSAGVSGQMEPLLGKGSLLLLTGERHRAMRRLLTPPFHGQRMRVYGQQIGDITRDQTRDLRVGSEFIAQERMRAITLQLILRIVFGVTDPALLLRLEAQVHAFLGSAGPLVFLLPQRELWGLSPYGRLMRARRDMCALLQEEIDAHRRAPRERTDIFGMLMAARYEDGSPMPDDELCDQLLTLLLAGFVTTATALTWALYFLHREPATLARLREELLALGPAPEADAIAQAPFLEAVCNESLRLRPQLAAITRKLARPMTIKGYEIPAGVSVAPNVIWAHLDPATYPEPERFRPERFLQRSYSPFEFIPFGGGFRRCIGAALALYEMKLVLATLLRRFTLQLLTTQDVPVVQGQGSLEAGVPIRLTVTAVDGQAEQGPAPSVSDRRCA